MYKCNIIIIYIIVYLEWDKKDEWFQKAKAKPLLNKI